MKEGFLYGSGNIAIDLNTAKPYGVVKKTIPGHILKKIAEEIENE
jgi:hypothetical protein